MGPLPHAAAAYAYSYRPYPRAPWTLRHSSSVRQNLCRACTRQPGGAACCPLDGMMEVHAAKDACIVHFVDDILELPKECTVFVTVLVTL